MHNLKAVAFFDANLIEGTSRDDFEIALHGNLARIEPKVVEHICESDSNGHVTDVAVEMNRNAFLQLHGAPP